MLHITLAETNDRRGLYIYTVGRDNANMITGNNMGPRVFPTGSYVITLAVCGLAVGLLVRL